MRTDLTRIYQDYSYCFFWTVFLLLIAIKFRVCHVPLLGLCFHLSHIPVTISYVLACPIAEAVCMWVSVRGISHRVWLCGFLALCHQSMCL